MIDLRHLRAFHARTPTRQRSDGDKTDRDPRFLSFINLPVLMLCVGSWAIVLLGVVSVARMA